MARKEKEAIVEQLAEKLSESAAVIVTDYRGLDVDSITELRAKLREADIKYKVVKNTLTRFAAEKAEIESMNELLTGPTALAFDKNDPVAPAKILSEFAKQHEALEIKGGVLDGDVIDASEVGNLAKLPSREELLATALMRMQGPLYGLAHTLQGVLSGLVYALDGVRQQKEQSEAS